MYYQYANPDVASKMTDEQVWALMPTIGKGNVFMLAPEITFRAQPHGTFKFLFNALYLGAAPAGGANSSNTPVAR